MKKVILALLFITGTAFMASAQNAPAPAKSPEQRALRMTKTLEKNLNLTVKQAKRIDGIYLNQAVELDSIRNYPSADKRADNQQKRYIKKTAKQQIMEVLSADQQQQFIQYQQKIKQKNNKKKTQEAAPAPDDDDDDNQG